MFQYSYVNLDIFKHQWAIDNIYIQFDIEGNQLRIYSGIIGHPKRNIYDYKSYHVCESNFHEYKENISVVLYLEIDCKYGSIYC